MILGDHRGSEQLLSGPGLTASVTVTRYFLGTLLPPNIREAELAGWEEGPQGKPTAERSSLDRLSFTHLQADQKGTKCEPEVYPRGIRRANKHLNRCLNSCNFAISMKIPFDSAVLLLEIYPANIYTKTQNTGMRVLLAVWETVNQLNGLNKV